jgi:hypothetical protein
MRILLTNNTLDERAGSELYVRDVALALIRRGHEPVAYSTRLGEVARELRAATVPVIDDLDQLAAPPDLIHGQHHLDAMTAVLRFPDVPAIYFCHGFLPWQEMPTRFPSIHLFVAVDDLCRERLQSEHGIAPERIRVVRNFVNLEKFTLREALPARPRRALVFSNNAREGGYLATLRDACRVEGIEVDAIGTGVGRNEQHPEQLLRGYDLVFAKARAALEALAVGVSVIACDMNGLGGMVGSDNFDYLRRLNFGARTLNRSITVDSVRQEIARYDAGDARKVSLRVRDEAGLEGAVDQLMEIYQETLARRTAIDPHAAMRDASRYMASIADIAKGRVAESLALQLARTEAFAQAESARGAHAQLARVAGDLGSHQHALAAREAESAELHRQLAQRHQEVDALRVQLVAHQDQLGAMQQQLSERDAELRSALRRLADRNTELEKRNQPWSVGLGFRRMRKVLLKQPLAALRKRVG